MRRDALSQTLVRELRSKSWLTDVNDQVVMRVVIFMTWQGVQCGTRVKRMRHVSTEWDTCIWSDMWHLIATRWANGHDIVPKILGVYKQGCVIHLKSFWELKSERELKRDGCHEGDQWVGTRIWWYELLIGMTCYYMQVKTERRLETKAEASLLTSQVSSSTLTPVVVDVCVVTQYADYLYCNIFIL